MPHIIIFQSRDISCGTCNFII